MNGFKNGNRAGVKTASREISPDRILLCRLALLSRDRNFPLVTKLLADFYEREMPEVGSQTFGGGAPRRNADSDPRTLALAELAGLQDDAGTRVVNALEGGLGAIYVGDLDKWRAKDIRRVAMLGEGGWRKLVEALRGAGVKSKKIEQECKLED